MKLKENLKSKKGTKGITLVALVVTIVVLLILAGITITMLFSDNGIITKAREASDAVNKSQSDTINRLGNLEDYLSEAVGKYAWKVSSDGTKVVNKNYPEGIEIGSYINYDCTPVNGGKTSYESKADKNGYADQTFTVADYKNKGWGWRVLGADNKGQLLLISEETVPVTISNGEDNTFGNGDRMFYIMQGKAGYENGISELEKICDIYGHGAGATGGKLIAIEEINKMTGLNENNIDGNGNKSEEGRIDEYENKITYYWDGTDKPYYETSNGLKGNLTWEYSNFTWYEEETKGWKISEKSTTATTDKKEKITTLTNTFYGYDAPDGKLDTNSIVYKMLFCNSSTGAYKDDIGGSSEIYYYINSYATFTTDYSAMWGIGSVFENSVLSCNNVDYYSNGEESADLSGVRPVVSLKSNIKLKANGTRDNCTLYDLSEK